jgi:hypothetical protein
LIYVEAPNRYSNGPEMSHPMVFLAGGITNCPDWQQDVRKILGDLDLPEFYLVNPRRDNFPIHDPNAALEQITWEFHALNQSNIFSMWFSNAESDQPICMYELGRHLVRFGDGMIDYVCIGVEPGYRRSQDVAIQTQLAMSDGSGCAGEDWFQADSLEQHAKNIAHCVKAKHQEGF